MTAITPEFTLAPLQQIVQSQAHYGIETLPFNIRIVDSDLDLKKAIGLRHAAYNRHVPEFAASLITAEDADFDESTIIMIAESKLDGSILGTLRVQQNNLRPLPVEDSIRLPGDMGNTRLAEATRLAVGGGGRVVTIALFKAFYMFCKLRSIDTMVITARSPIDRQYERLMFKDVDPTLGFIKLPHVGNIKHRIMSLEVQKAESLFRGAKHPLTEFFLSTKHADIDISIKEKKPANVRFGKLYQNKIACSILPTYIPYAAVHNTTLDIGARR
jgi:hypothetical protein